jgi:hypothetical protein
MDSDQNNDMTVPAPQEPINADAFKPQSGQVIDVPSYPSEPMKSEPVVSQEVPTYSSTPLQGEVVTGQVAPSYNSTDFSPPPAKKDNKKICIIVGVVLAVLCCCCIVVTILSFRAFDNMDTQQLEDLLDQYNRFIQLMPAFV